MPRGALVALRALGKRTPIGALARFITIISSDILFKFNMLEYTLLNPSRECGMVCAGGGGGGRLTPWKLKRPHHAQGASCTWGTHSSYSI